MTKKHFIALADAIKDHNLNWECVFDRHQINTLADFCASQNPNFDRAKWMAYINGECGPNGGKLDATLGAPS